MNGTGESLSSKGRQLRLWFRNPNHVSMVLALATASIGLIWVFLAVYVVPALIQSAYLDQSLPVFNRLISGQATHPVSEYIAAWDAFRWRVLLDFSLVCLLIGLALRPEFRRALRATVAYAEPWAPRPGYRLYLYLALVVSTAYFLYFSLGLAVSPLHVRFFFDRFLFDPNDLFVYFNSSAWAVGKGKLYFDVRSEYPVLANLIFGAVRVVSSKIHLLSSEFENFSLMWVVCASMAFVLLLRPLSGQKTSLASSVPLLFLAPAPIYYSLFRFDIYPVVFCVWGLFHIRKRNWAAGAFLLGVCIALKGYALIIIPCFFAYAWSQIGFFPALNAVFILLAPLIVSNLAVLAWGGKEALLAPYKLQVFRKFNGESSFDSFFFLMSHLGTSQARIAILKSWLLKFHLPKMLQAVMALLAACFRPTRFESFVHGALLSVLGFMAFSSFYSPQYVLWLLPFLLFTNDRVLFYAGIFLAWISYIYFPVAYYSGHRTFFGLSVLAVTASLFLLMGRALNELASQREHRGEEAGTGAPSLKEGIARIAEEKS